MSPTKDRHRREREARGKAILAAAATVFARHGLEATTIGMVAREAEVAVGTIYLYFQSRDELYLRLIVERNEQLRERYLEIQSRTLPALDELRAIANAYIEHLRDHREVLLGQQSVGFSKLGSGLRRQSEKKNFRRAMELSHEIWNLWERTVSRAVDGGLVANPMGAKGTASVIWASLHGAFILMGDDNFFRDLTGLNPEHFVEQALEAHLTAAGSNAAAKNDRDAARNGHGEDKSKENELRAEA